MLIGLYLSAYLLGSLPFGFWVGKARGIDIRKVGSGNIGATNTYRHLGAKAGLLVFALDVGKGAAPVLLARALLDPQTAATHDVWLGLAAVVGHTFSPFLGFKGGKGVATGLGAVLGLAPIVGIVGFSVFLISLFVSKYVSLSSILGTTAVVVTGFATHQSPLFLTVFTLVCAFVIVRHIPNMKRLLNRTEPKFKFKKDPAPVTGDKQETGGGGAQ